MALPNAGLPLVAGASTGMAAASALPLTSGPAAPGAVAGNCEGSTEEASQPLLVPQWALRIRASGRILEGASRAWRLDAAEDDDVYAAARPLTAGRSERWWW